MNRDKWFAFRNKVQFEAEKARLGKYAFLSGDVCALVWTHADGTVSWQASFGLGVEPRFRGNGLPALETLLEQSGELWWA